MSEQSFYAIVVFLDDDNSVAVVPTCWLDGDHWACGLPLKTKEELDTLEERLRNEETLKPKMVGESNCVYCRYFCSTVLF